MCFNVYFVQITVPSQTSNHSCCVCFDLARTDITVTLKVFVEFSVISEMDLSSC